MSWRQRLYIDGVVAAERSIGRSLTLATVFAVNAAVCCAILFGGYRLEGSANGVGWAVVSSILVLIPDLKQTVATALARVSANIVGAVTGLLVVKHVGEGPEFVVLGVVIVSYVCHLCRIDLGLRTACVSVVIVMMSHGIDIGTTSLERFVSVLVGCAVGVSVQLAALAVQKRLGRKSDVPAPPMTAQQKSVTE